jgi:hypothetical protein
MHATGLIANWLPLVLSAVFVFIMSSLIHMVGPWHKTDYLALPNQDAVMDALRPFAIPPGDYMVPRPASMAEMRSPEFAAKIAKGPVIIATVKPSEMTGMGQNLVLWFLYSLVVNALAEILTFKALGPGAPYPGVFKWVFATAFLGYSVALAQHSIWYSRKWSTTVKSMFDGAIYAAVTAGTFGWLWPR